MTHAWHTLFTLAGFEFCIGAAGLLTIISPHEHWCLHLLPSREHWMFGHSVESYDGFYHYYGAGPIALVVRS